MFGFSNAGQPTVTIRGAADIEPIGLPVAYSASKVVKAFLFGMQPQDPLAMGVAAGVLIAAATLAGYAPARRASRIDPMRALREE